MDAEDGTDLGSIPMMFLSSSDPSKQREDVLSPEDIAWADSCLTKDPEVLESGWDALRQAMLETLEFAAAKSDSNKVEDNEGDINRVPSTEESEISTKRAEDSDNVLQFLTDEADEGSENPPVDENSEPQTSVVNPFLPNYKEFPDEAGEERVSMSSEFRLESLENEPTSEDIFKVWELEMPEEEDEFSKLLNKVLAEPEEEVSPQLSPLLPGTHSGGWKDDGSIHDLVAGITDLSLGLDS